MRSATFRTWRRETPLDFLPSIKLKLGAIIVGAVGVAVVVISLGVKLRVWPYLTVALAGLLALAMVQLLARGIVSPLREMSVAAGAMARGDYDRRVTATSRDEVGDLARAFNAMAAELAEVDRVRRDLVANVSHELRTPITALRAGLENLVDGVEPTDPATLRTMLDQVERLGRLVTQLLDLSKLESGAVPLNRQRFARPSAPRPGRARSPAPRAGNDRARRRCGRDARKRTPTRSASTRSSRTSSRTPFGTHPPAAP